MELTPDQLHRRLDAVATDSWPPGPPDLDRVRARARHRRARRRAITSTAVVVVLAGGIIGAVLASSDRDVGAPAVETPSTTTSTPTTRTLIERPTPLGTLRVVVGPHLRPWIYGPGGSTDRWREPARCYPPELRITVGSRSATSIGDSRATVAQPTLLPLTLREHPDDVEAALVDVVLGAADGTRYRLTSTSGTDEVTAADGIAVLVAPALVNPSQTSDVLTEPTVAVVEADGTTTPLALDMATAENLLYAGDSSRCAAGDGAAPPATVPTPADVADAVDVAARALDPATDRSAALRLFSATDGVGDQLDALHDRLGDLTGSFRTTFHFRADTANAPAFTSPSEGWVSVQLAGDDGFQGPATWAKVVRTADGWRVRPDTVCGAFATLILAVPAGACPGW